MAVHARLSPNEAADRRAIRELGLRFGGYEERSSTPDTVARPAYSFDEDLPSGR